MPEGWRFTPGGTPICRPISSACIMTPYFFANLTLFYRSSHLVTPFFQNFNVNFKIFARILKILSIFNWKKKVNFHLNLTKIYTKWPPIFGSSHTQWPPFSKKSYTECPLISLFCRHIPVTFMLECPRDLPQNHNPIITGRVFACHAYISVF